MYTIQWKGRIYKASTYEDAMTYAKRITAFEYDGHGNKALIRSPANGAEERLAYVIWLDNNLSVMQWVIIGTLLIEEEK